MEKEKYKNKLDFIFIFALLYLSFAFVANSIFLLNGTTQKELAIW